MRIPRLLALALLAARAAGAQGGTHAPVAAITGAVFDSLSLRPMASAVVQLARLGPQGRVEATLSAPTDSAGHYSFDDVPLGSYLLGFQHLAIDTLGFRSPVHRIDVRKPGTMHVELAIPAMASIVAAVCGKTTVADSLSLLVGSVRDAVSDGVIAHAYVSVKWAEVFLTRAGMVRDMPTHDLHTNEEGWFMACVPSGVPVTAHAEQDSLRSGDVEVITSTLVVLRRDLYIGAAAVEIVTAGDSVRSAGAVNAGDRLVASGTGIVRGVVRRLDGRPLAGARVRVSGARGETRSDSTGAFLLRNLPHGTRTVEARALGYMPDEALVDVVSFRESVVQLTLAGAEGTLLDTVRVRGRARMAEALNAGFERRRSSGVGRFIDESVLDTLKVHTFSEIVHEIPGIVFRDGRTANDAFERQVFFIGGGRSEPCTPTIYLDGIRLLQLPTDLDQLVNPATIRRVEVYMSGTTPPAEFASSSGCGVLSLWTLTKLPPGRRSR